MAASDAPADVDAETSESDPSVNDRLDDAETCAAVAEVTGEPCGNPAILGTGRCHMHLDYTELPAAESSDETDAKPYRRRTPTVSHTPRSGESGRGD